MKSRHRASSPTFRRGFELFGPMAVLWAALAAVSAGQFVPTNPNAPAVLAQPGMPAAQRVGGAGGAFQLTTTADRFEFFGPVVRGPGGSEQLGFSTKTGVQIEVDVNGIAQFGYQPVAITARLARPALADREVRVEFHVGSWHNDGRSMTARATFTLAAGDTSASANILVPQYQTWEMGGWDVWVDGQPDDELSIHYVNFSQQSGNFGVSALVASPDVSDMEVQGVLQAAGNATSTVRYVAPSDLPMEWLRYSTIDVVVMTAGDLAKLAANQPRQSAALARWLRAGGNLWLVDGGKSWENMPTAERALGLRRTASGGAPADDQDDADAALVARGWRFVPLGERELEPVEGALELSGYDDGDEKPPVGARPTARQTGLAGPIESSSPWFVVRTHGMGAVTAFRGTVPVPQGVFPGGMSVPNGRTLFPEAEAIQRSLLMPRMTSVGRHGNKPDEANPEFNNFLVPGVGVAPVGQFQFLITLFVLAIGPLNYWWLKRHNKLPWLLVTVPLAALAVTALLLSFGVLSDGLGVRVRARSLTLLDQTAGEAATWARLSYYAGITPREGLTMPPDTVMYPVLSQWSMGRYGRGPSLKREISWSTGQRLTRGWLPSRTPTQYLAINSRPTQKRLELRVTDEGLRVVNRLGVTLTHAVVQDRSGKLYWCEDLAPDAGRVVPAVQANAVSGKLRQLFSDHLPEFPPGAETTMFGGAYYGNMLSKNLMEAQLEAINHPIVQKWVNGSYVAITDRGVEVDLGIDDATEEQSFHVIRGSW